MRDASESGSVEGQSPSAIVRRSALAALLKTGRCGDLEGEPGLLLSEARVGLVLHVHAYRDPEGVGSRLVRALALTGEATSGRVLDGGSRALLKLSTLDWLVRAEAAWPDLCRSLRTELSDLASVTELSNARTVIRVQGPHAVSVLAQGVSLDLSDLAFPPGGFAQTRCGPFAVLLSRDRSGDRWDLMVHRSYAVSLWEWLLNAGASVGVQVQA